MDHYTSKFNFILVKNSHTRMDFLEIAAKRHELFWIQGIDQHEVCMSLDIEQFHWLSGRGGKRGRGWSVGDRQTAGLTHPYHPVKDEVNF